MINFKDIKNVFIIAEAGVNHNGNINTAFELVREAKKAGADCVKFQTFKSERVVQSNAEKAAYQKLVTDPNESQLSMLKKLELTVNDYRALISFSNDQGIEFSSTPYNEEDIDLLLDLDIKLLKAASIHIAEPRFLQRMAETGLPLIVSTGMANWAEIDEAINAILATGNTNFSLLQCTTNYPSQINDVNLNAMVEMKRRYNCAVGYSDHTQTQTACIGSVALGGCVIEKHLTLDTKMQGPDHQTSETPEEFAKLVRSIRETELAMGSAIKQPAIQELLNMPNMRRSIVARKIISKGELLDDLNMTCSRPMSGISPKDWKKLIGKVVITDINQGDQIAYKNLATIRKMTLEDAAILETMMNREDKKYMQYFTAFKENGSLLRQVSVAKNDIFNSIKINTNLVGFYCLRGIDQGYALPGFGIYISSNFTRKGLALGALRHAILQCGCTKCNRIMLHVAPENTRARLIYEKFGFIYSKDQVQTKGGQLKMTINLS